MTTETLTERRLNRALLARQFLLERSSLPITDVLERVGGLQTQYAPSAGKTVHASTERLGVVMFRDEARKKLVDLPDMPLPPEGTHAPHEDAAIDRDLPRRRTGRGLTAVRVRSRGHPRVRPALAKGKGQVADEAERLTEFHAP